MSTVIATFPFPLYRASAPVAGAAWQVGRHRPLATSPTFLEFP